jgi:hypothetical protein
MQKEDALWRFPDLKLVLQKLDEVHEDIVNAHRPAEEVIFNDVKLQQYLGVSRRTTSYYRSRRLLTYIKVDAIILYRLSDILSFLDMHEVPAISSTLKIKLANG